MLDIFQKMMSKPVEDTDCFNASQNKTFQLLILERLKLVNLLQLCCIFTLILILKGV